MKYAIIIEHSANGYGAYAPDLPGVGVVADTAQEARELIRQAITFHLDGLRQDGEPIPQPTVQIDYIDTPAA